MELIFLSGKYRGDVEANISHAERVAKVLWQQGYAVICPHLNTARFDSICPDDVWLTGYLEMLSRCDSIFMLTEWENSEGAKAELELAQKLGMKVYYE